MTIKTAKIGDLTPDENNANKGTERGRYALEKSLREYGFGRAILIDKNGHIIAGNKTHEVAGSIGLEEVLVVPVNGQQVVAVQRIDLDIGDLAAKELAIADNRVGQLDLDWDTAVLQALEDEGANLGAFWNQEELDALMAGLGQEEDERTEQGEDEDAADPDQVVPRDGVELGSIWQLGRHRIMMGDSTVEANIKTLLGDRIGDVGMVWSDPPYGISIVAANESVGGGEAYDYPFGGVKNMGYVGGDNCKRTSIEECRQRKDQGKKSSGLGSIGGAKPFGSKDIRGSVGASNVVAVNKYAPIIGDDTIDTAVNAFNAAMAIAEDAIHIWWGGNYFASALPNSSCWLVWDKENTGNFADAELAWCNHKSAVRIFKHMWNGMVKASEHGQRRVHPTQKPIALCEWAFEKYGQQSDIIFDPFLGSAPSIIAAQKMEGDRTVYGMELSPEYIEVILQRWEKFASAPAKRIN